MQAEEIESRHYFVLDSGLPVHCLTAIAGTVFGYGHVADDPAGAPTLRMKPCVTRSTLPSVCNWPPRSTSALGDGEPPSCLLCPRSYPAGIP